MSVKKLSINPDFFRVSNSKSKKKTKKQKNISSSLLNKTIKPNDIKKKLLQVMKKNSKNVFSHIIKDWILDLPGDSKQMIIKKENLI